MGNNANNKRIAKNTLMLYVRMLLTMAVTLYTSRVILQVLGVEDFGIYNIVGGVVTMLAFLNSSLNTATQRYMNFEMGRNNLQGVKDVFSVSFISYCIIAIIVVILSETVGLWFVYHKLVIPASRLSAAVWVFHFSILTFVVNLLTVPYNAAIIAYERMSIYAYVSIADVILRLLMVFLLQIVTADKLILYAIMMFLVTVVVGLAYFIFCHRLFSACRVRWTWNTRLMKGLFSFSGWMLSGTITNLLSTQGVNILINVFFGPALNAARAIAVQVQSAVNSFVANFLTATRPQIMQSYAQGNTDYMNKLVFSASKFSFFLLFILSISIFFNASLVLNIWLKHVPEYAALFTQLVLVDLWINAAYSPIAYVSQASGKIRNYQLAISVGFVLIAALTWGAFKLGYPVYTTFIISIVIDILGLFVRLWVLYNIVRFPVVGYLKKVLWPIVYLLALSLLFSYILELLFKPEHIYDFFVYTCICFFFIGGLIWMIGLDKSEQNLLMKSLNKVIKH